VEGVSNNSLDGIAERANQRKENGIGSQTGKQKKSGESIVGSPRFMEVLAANYSVDFAATDGRNIGASKGSYWDDDPPRHADQDHLAADDPDSSTGDGDTILTMANSKPSPDSILRRLRKGCMALPDATETVSFGHPTFQVNGKAFAVLEEYKGELSICVKVGTNVQGVFLADNRFYRTPYIGKHGWISLKVHAAPLDWDEIYELLKGSHGLVNVKNLRGAASRRIRAIQTD
jgi:predicted DNA-binding protein (MmcQ/YjbR family)